MDYDEDDLEQRRKRLPDHEWAYRRPPVLLPVPAADARPLTGKRVVAWATGGVWRYDVRAATEPHWYEDRWCVGVLDEGDWYRRERDPSSCAALVPRPYPLDWLWVEQPVAVGDVAEPEPVDQPQSWFMGYAAHLVARTDAPPVRYPRPALAAPAVPPGARAVLMAPEGPQFRLRVAGMPRLGEFPETLNLTGLEELDEVPIGPVVPLCWEDQWYRWVQDGVPPNAGECWLVAVWLE